MNLPQTGMRRWALALTALASFIVALDGLVTAAALTSIQQSFDATLAELQWTSNAYNLSFAVLLSIGAAIGDRLGRKRVFAAGLALFALASVGCALAGSVTALIAARAVQGAGAALVMPMALAILSVAFPADQRGKALGIFGSITGLAPLSGPAIGGAISEAFHWTWIFWINVPIVIVLIPLALSRLEESRGPATRVDIPGIALIGGMSFAAAWALMRGNETGWASAEVLSSIGAAIVLLLAVVAWLRRTSDPVIPPRLFAAKGFGGGLMAAFFLYGALYATLFFITQFLQVAQGYGPLEAGLRLLPWTATLFFVAPVAGSLVNRVGERPLVVAGLALNTLGLAWLGLTASAAMTLAAMAPALVAMGVGVSLAMPALQSGVLRAVPPADIGKASGSYSMAQFIGGVFGIAIAACVFSAFGSYANPQAFTDGFRAMIGSAAVMTALGALMAIGLSTGLRGTGTLTPATP
jgi:EmrB/QacA subfamily drug resistance transporter